MRMRTISDIVKQVHKALAENEYMKARDLVKSLHTKASNIYRSVRILREGGTEAFPDPVGIHSTKHGYVLSECAKKVDDVNYIRRLAGRRASDFIGIRASAPHIQKRWRGLKDRNDMRKMLGPVMSGGHLLESGIGVIMKRGDELGL